MRWVWEDLNQQLIKVDFFILVIINYLYMWGSLMEADMLRSHDPKSHTKKNKKKKKSIVCKSQRSCKSPESSVLFAGRVWMSKSGSHLWGFVEPVDRKASEWMLKACGQGILHPGNVFQLLCVCKQICSSFIYNRPSRQHPARPRRKYMSVPHRPNTTTLKSTGTAWREDKETLLRHSKTPGFLV